MKEKDIHICSSEINWQGDKTLARIINHISPEYCQNTAKYFENGYWYCGLHAPSKIEERSGKRYAKWHSLNEARKKHKEEYNNK
jgi:hypothetical protein